MTAIGRRLRRDDLAAALTEAAARKHHTREVVRETVSAPVGLDDVVRKLSDIDERLRAFEAGRAADARMVQAIVTQVERQGGRLAMLETAMEVLRSLEIVDDVRGAA